MATTSNFMVRPKPSLWGAYRHELFKGSKQVFYKVIVIFPFFLVLALSLIQLLIKALANPKIPANLNSDLSSIYDFGSGAYNYATSIVFNGLAPTYRLVIILASAMLVANEYRWNMIKLLATRQPVRVKLVISKALFALTLSVCIFISMSLGWLICGLCSKLFFDLPLELTSADFDAIGKGLSFYAIGCLQTYILALAAMVTTYFLKSIVGGIITYTVYKLLDGVISGAGVGATNNGLESFPEWLRPIMAVAKFLNPVMLSSNTNRVGMRAEVLDGSGVLVSNPQIVTSTPLWWAWLVLVAYVILFTALSALIFARRDITD